MNAIESLKFFLPETFLLIGAFFALLLDLFVKNKKAVGLLALVILAGTAGLAKVPTASYPLFFGFFTLDSFTHFFRLISLAVIGFTVITSLTYQPISKDSEGEYYCLLLFMAFALILMSAANNLLMIFLAVEFVSVVSYLLVGFLRTNPRSKEASIKYFLFGSFCSGVMLYGMSLLFGATGSLELTAVSKTIANQPPFTTLMLCSLILFLVGMGFKISMAPFHLWAPDAYEAAPTPVTALLTVAPKAVGFALLIRVLSVGFISIGWKWQTLIMLLSILTMTLGNIIALSQTNIKRLLAYSSIAQAGYILMGIAVFNDLGLTGVLIYLLAYAFTNIGAFTVVITVSNYLGNDELPSYAGLAKRSPFLAAAMAIFLLSLAGLPPMAGFIGKFYVFSATLQAGFVKLALAAAMNSAIAAFYYFKIVRLMYLEAPVREDKVPLEGLLTLSICLLLTGVILMGVFPSPFIQFVKGMLLV